MPGFFIEIGNSSKSKNLSQNKKFDNKIISADNFYAERRTLKKFLDDKLFVDSEQYFYVLDGVILNKYELLENNSSSWADIFISLYETEGDEFYKKFRGSFCGALFDKKKDRWIIFSDHIGSKFLYFSTNGGNLVVSTDIDVIYEYFKTNKIKYELNKDAAYLLLSYGFMLEDYTLCTEIKKLLPGHYLLYKNKNFISKQYYELNTNIDYSKTEDELIEEMDFYFRQAISRQFKKDKEYGYKHLVALSGGLDSRMTSMVAHDLGYQEQLNITFSQSDYLDETIAKEIASNLNHEWLFKALDGGNFLLDYQEVTKVTGGNVLIYGLAHGNSLYKYMNFDSLGLLHSGQLGDVIFGTFSGISHQNEKWKLGDGAYSKSYLNKLKNIKIKQDYKNKEIFMIINRGLIGANNGQLMPQQYTETISPFYDIDLIDFALSIPLEFRKDHKIYKKWIINKYPLATKYKWEKTQSKITEPIIRFQKKEYHYREFILLVINKLSKNKLFGINTKKNMNPLGYWFETNFTLRIIIDKFFNDNVEFVEDIVLRKDLKELYDMGNATEKVQAISLLAAIIMFFSSSQEI